MQMLAEFLVKPQEAADAQRGDQKRNRETRRVAGQQKNSFADGIFCSRDGQNTGQNWPDARRPAKRECKTHYKSAERPGLATQAVEAHVTIEPARERRSKEKNKRERKEMNRFQVNTQHGGMKAQRAADRYENRSEHKSHSNRNLREQAGEMQAEHQDQGARNRRERSAIAQQERTHGAGGSPERNEDHGKPDDKSERRPQKSTPRCLPFLQLFYANTRQH